MAAVLLAGITTSSHGQARQDEQPHRRLRRSEERVGIKPLNDFHNHPIDAGDLHRADMAWAKHAAGCGLTVEQIKDDLLVGRDLSKKGTRKRQLEYVTRTAEKALRSL